MITRILDKIIERWLYAIARELLKEAKDTTHYKPEDARIFAGIASALNRANIKNSW